MHQRSRAIAGLAAGLLAACGGAGADDAEQPQGGDAVKARLISERVRLVPGQEAWLGVTFEIRPKWHLYWNGLNETGGPPEVALTLPAGFTAGKIVWPAPMRHVLGGDILDHIYEKRVTLLIPVRVPASAEPGSTARFQAALTWMVCEEVCVLGETSVSLGLPVGEPGAGDPPPSPDEIGRAHV